MDYPQPTRRNEINNATRNACYGLSAVIPAYNEEKSIGRILEILSQVPEIDKIVVVDDGSTDATVQEASLAAERDSRIQIIRHASNRGKGQAVFTGLKESGSSCILMLDADLVGLAPRHIRSLVRPVMRGEADMTLGLFKGGELKSDLGHWATPWLSGQRCLRSELFEKLPMEAANGYGLETALTVIARAQGWRIRRVTLKGVSHPPSEIHRGFLCGARTRLRMYAQIVRAWILASGLNP